MLSARSRRSLPRVRPEADHFQRSRGRRHRSVPHACGLEWRQVTRTAKESALITGGVRRIGASLAQHLAKRGYHVFVHAHTASEAGKEFIAKIIADGGSAELATADLGNPADVQDMMATVFSSEAPLA